jgi:hypothetical protein
MEKANKNNQKASLRLPLYQSVSVAGPTFVTKSKVYNTQGIIVF